MAINSPQMLRMQLPRLACAPVLIHMGQAKCSGAIPVPSENHLKREELQFPPVRLDPISPPSCVPVSIYSLCCDGSSSYRRKSKLGSLKLFSFGAQLFHTNCLVTIFDWLIYMGYITEIMMDCIVMYTDIVAPFNGCKHVGVDQLKHRAIRDIKLCIKVLISTAAFLMLP